MEKYWDLWMRGWWVWLMIFTINIGFALVLIPIDLAFHDNKIVYWLANIIIVIFIGTPFAGWIFERFATKSARIN